MIPIPSAGDSAEGRKQPSSHLHGPQPVVPSGKEDTVLRDASKDRDPNLDLGTRNFPDDVNLTKPKLFLDQSISSGKADLSLVLALFLLYQDMIQIPM